MSYERANIRRMTGYAYGAQPDDPDVVKLNTNENPYPPSPAVAEALAAFDAATLRRYPPATAEPLRRQFAAQLGLRFDEVVATNGGDEALRLALTTFVDPGATLGLTEPAYSLLPVLAAAQDCRVCAVELAEDWRPPADFAARMNAANAKLVCIVNPHAPSGVLLPADAIVALAHELDGVLLVDEAYVDFVNPARQHDLAKAVRTCPNLLLLRTLSKGYALAGLRVGFLVGQRALIAPVLTKTRDSFNVDAIAQTLAAAALADGEYAAARWREIRAERQRLAASLRDLGFAAPDSETNFLLARTPAGVCASKLQHRLRERRILVRYFATPRLRNCLRITIGTPTENDALLAALGELAALG